MSYTKNGFTLVEVMISVSILSIGLVLILQGLTFSLNALRIAQDNLEATLAAQNLMVQAQLQAKEDWQTFSFGLNEKLEFAGLECDWELRVEPLEWQLEELPENYEDLNQIEASLTWQEGKRKGRVQLVTLMEK